MEYIRYICHYTSITMQIRLVSHISQTGCYAVIMTDDSRHSDITCCQLNTAHWPVFLSPRLCMADDLYRLWITLSGFTNRFYSCQIMHNNNKLVTNKHTIFWWYRFFDEDQICTLVYYSKSSGAEIVKLQWVLWCSVPCIATNANQWRNYLSMFDTRVIWYSWKLITNRHVSIRVFTHCNRFCIETLTHTIS